MRTTTRPRRPSYNTKVALAGLGALAVVASLGGGAGGAPAATASPAGRTIDAETIRDVDFGEVAQPGSACAEGLRFSLTDDIPVSDGRSQVLDLARLTQLTVDPDVAVGDVTGDGVADAVVHVQCSFGANGVEDSVHLWTLDGGRLRHVASVADAPDGLGDGAQTPAVQGVAAADGRLTVTYSHYEDGDPRCCASGQTRVGYELDDEDLVQVGEPTTRAVQP